MLSKAKHRPSFDVEVNLDVDYFHSLIQDCLPVTEFRNEYLISEMLSKLPRDGTSAATRADNAIKKMLESEDVCRSINQDGYRCNTPRDYFSQVHLYASNLVAEVLGDFDYGLFEVPPSLRVRLLVANGNLVIPFISTIIRGRSV